MFTDTTRSSPMDLITHRASSILTQQEVPCLFLLSGTLFIKWFLTSRRLSCCCCWVAKSCLTHARLLHPPLSPEFGAKTFSQVEGSISSWSSWMNKEGKAEGIAWRETESWAQSGQIQSPGNLSLGPREGGPTRIWTPRPVLANVHGDQWLEPGSYFSLPTSLSHPLSPSPCLPLYLCLLLLKK